MSKDKDIPQISLGQTGIPVLLTESPILSSMNSGSDYFFFFFVTLSTPPLPRDNSVVSRDQPIFPRYTPCILISRIGSALPHRVNSQQTTQLTTLFTHARTLPTMGIKHYEEKIPTQLGSNPRFSHLEADVGPLHHRVAAAYPAP